MSITRAEVIVCLHLGSIIMLKKSLVTASLLLACAVAWGVAQDNLGPSILAKPIQSTQETESKTESKPPSLSTALKSAQQNAVADYSSTPG